MTFRYVAFDVEDAIAVIRIGDPNDDAFVEQSHPMHRELRDLLRGHPLTAEDAAELGVVAELVDTPDDVLPASRALAAKLARTPASAYATTKRALNAWVMGGGAASLAAAVGLQVGT